MTYGKLPPLNPDDLKLPPPPPSAADKVRSEDAISLSEVWEEIKAKMKEMYVDWCCCSQRRSDSTMG